MFNLLAGENETPKTSRTLTAMINLYFYHFLTLDFPTLPYLFPLFIEELDYLRFPLLRIVSFGLIFFSTSTLAIIQRKGSPMPYRQTRSDYLKRREIRRVHAKTKSKGLKLEGYARAAVHMCTGGRAYVHGRA